LRECSITYRRRVVAPAHGLHGVFRRADAEMPRASEKLFVGRDLARRSPAATALVAGRRYAATGLTETFTIHDMSCVLRNDRLLGLALLDWSVLLGGSMLCGLLTLLF
jgi:hypothetical protein